MKDVHVVQTISPKAQIKRKKKREQREGGGGGKKCGEKCGEKWGADHWRRGSFSHRVCVLGEI
jgi:hypothetical protein